MSDDYSSQTTGAAAVTPTRKKVKAKAWYQQVFREEWLSDSELKDWIKPDSGNRFVVICTVCSCTLSNINKTALLAHKDTVKY